MLFFALGASRHAGNLFQNKYTMKILIPDLNLESFQSLVFKRRSKNQ